MAKEVRRLVFDIDELRAIIDGYLKSPDISGPKGKVNDLFLRDDGPVTGMLHLQGPDGRQLTRDIDEGFLISAIVNKCVDFHVPVCRKAQKHIRKLSNDAGWALDMAMGQVFVAQTGTEPEQKAS